MSRQNRVNNNFQDFNNNSTNYDGYQTGVSSLNSLQNSIINYLNRVGATLPDIYTPIARTLGHGSYAQSTPVYAPSSPIMNNIQRIQRGFQNAIYGFQQGYQEGYQEGEQQGENIGYQEGINIPISTPQGSPRRRSIRPQVNQYTPLSNYDELYESSSM